MASQFEEILSFIWEVAKIVVLALVIVIPIRYFIFQPFIIDGSSMEPNFYDGDYLIVNEFTYRFSQPARGDVIVFHYPKDPGRRYIKRVIGLPGETIEARDSHVFITKDGKTTQLDESKYLPSDTRIPTFGPVLVEDGNYYVLGDNRQFSSDSHEWGPLPRSKIIGSVLFRLWPIKSLAKFETPQYAL